MGIGLLGMVLCWQHAGCIMGLEAGLLKACLSSSWLCWPAVASALWQAVQL
jgi:hypothetical protein